MDWFSHIVGNEPLKQYLQRMVEKRTIANSMLFAGPDGIGKGLFADALARLVLCQDDPQGIHKRKLDSGVHPDLRIYRPEGKIGAHSIESMRQFAEDVRLSPFEATRKVFIIHDADRMLSYSANALLKTFEEPTPWSIIILLTSAPEALLPTIVSRCHTLHFQPVPEAQIEQLLLQKGSQTPDTARAMAVLAEGSVGHAIKLAADGGDRLRKRLLQLLSQGKFATYSQLMEAAAEISGYIEEGQKQSEEAFRTEILKSYSGDPTAIQQQAIDKEIDGRNAMHLFSQAKVLFAVVLSWYRDIQLLQSAGRRTHLINKDYVDQAEQALQRGEILPLTTVQSAVGQTMLSLERSTPLRSCLESLFLQLHF